MPLAVALDHPSPPDRPRALARELAEPVKPVSITLRSSDLAGLDALSLAQRVNRSALVRRAIRAMLAASTGKGKNEPVKNGDAKKGTR